MAITATPRADGSVALYVSIGSPTLFRAAYLTRSDANGTNDVRTLPGTIGQPGGVNPPIAVVDYEAALTGPVTYRVLLQTSSGVGTEDSATITLDGIGPEASLRSAYRPAFGANPTMVLGINSRRDYGSVFYPVIGRPDPVASIGPQSLRTGTIELLCDTRSLARQLEVAMATGDPMLLRQGEYGDALDLYFLPSSVSVNEDTNRQRAWLLTCEFVEIARPSGFLLGALSWTVAALAATFPTIRSVPAVYRTVNALTVGPTS